MQIPAYPSKSGYIHYHYHLAHIAPLTVRTLLYGNDTYEIEENKIIITEKLRFIKESKRFDWWYIYINYQLCCD